MSQDLRTELKTYMSYLDTQAPAISLDDIAPAIVPVAHPALNRRRGWLVAAAAAALTIVVVGSIAWLAPFGGQTPPATENPTPTTVDLTPTTLAAVPLGQGPKLSFVQTEAPTGGQLRGGEWFKGGLYVVSNEQSNNQEMFRSTDGFTWELVPGLPEASNVLVSMLQTDGDRLVNVVMPRDGSWGIRSNPTIQVNTSTNGVDWTSSSITVPIPIGSNMAGAFHLDNGVFSDIFAVGPKGIVVTATIDLVFEGEGFASNLVDPDDGIHVEIVDLDLQRNMMVVRFLDEENDMVQIGDLLEVDLGEAGFSNAFSNLLDAMAADPDWKPLIPGFLAQLTGEGPIGASASASVGYAWFSPDGVDWQRIDSTGPLDGGDFASIVATPDGFVAIASSAYRPSELPPEMRYLSESFDSSVVWQSTDGTTWTEAPDLTTRHGFDRSRLVKWQGELVEQVGWAQRRGDDTMMWTLAEPVRGLFSEIPTDGMLLEFSEFGLIGTSSYGWEEPGTIEILFSVDGTNWSRWEPAEFGQGDAQAVARILGVGKDFVVVQVRDPEDGFASSIDNLWVGTVS